MFTILYQFCQQTNCTDGVAPSTPMVQHTDGKLYGFTVHGGDTSVCGVGCGVFYSLDMGLGAFVTLGSTSGKESAKIAIFGQGFTSATTVSFGGTKATTVTRSGSTYLTATVPTGALTGSVTVTTGSTTLTSAQTFKVTPTMTSFSPPSGPVGTLVTINGTGLTQATKVIFNGKSASFTVVSDIEITATVPTGATTGKIKVTTKGGNVTSTTSFTVT
jgi:IPT/TIG domain